jgi:hypothetical protein
MVRESIRSLRGGEGVYGLRPPLISASGEEGLDGLRLLSAEDYYANRYLLPEVLEEFTDSEQEILKIITGLQEGDPEEIVSYDDVISAAGSRLGGESVAADVLQGLCQEGKNFRPAIISGVSTDSDGTRWIHIQEQDIYAKSLYEAQRGPDTYVERLKQIRERNQHLRNTCQNLEERFIVEAMIGAYPFEEGLDRSALSVEQIESAVKHSTALSSSEKHNLDYEDHVEELVRRGILVQAEPDKYRLRDHADDMSPFAVDRAVRFREKYGNDTLQKTIGEIERRNSAAAELATTESERILVAFMQDYNPYSQHLDKASEEGDGYSRLETAADLKIAFPDADILGAFESLRDRGLLMQMNDTDHWGSQSFKLSDHLAYL